MKAILFCVVAIVLNTHLLLAAEGGLEVGSTDSLRDILEQQTGKIVEVRLKSGDKLSGKVASVGDKVLHLSQLTGQEFFDAVIDVKDVTAVVVRARK